jgi:hypothetical protein
MHHESGFDLTESLKFVVRYPSRGLTLEAIDQASKLLVTVEIRPLHTKYLKALGCTRSLY